METALFEKYQAEKTHALNCLPLPNYLNFIFGNARTRKVGGKTVGVALESLVDIYPSDGLRYLVDNTNCFIVLCPGKIPVTFSYERSLNRFPFLKTVCDYAEFDKKRFEFS